MRLSLRLAAIGALAAPLPLRAQQPSAGCGADTVINVYRYILDVEPPESPALAVLEATTSHSRAATAPKPLALGLVSVAHGGEPAHTGAAIDLSPYFLTGGGIRTLCSYRDNSVAGRLKRVGTKTVISVGLLPLRGPGNLLRVGAAVRATLHDPHDPINNSQLVRRLRPAPAREELPPPGSDSIYEDVARAMRARNRWVVAAGWGAAATVSGGSLAHREGAWRHAVWLTWQRTLEARLDLLFTGEAGLERGASPGYRLTAAARRKQAHGDLLLEAAFDTRDERLHPGLSAEARIAPRVRAAVGVLTEPGAQPGSSRWVRAAASLRWSAGY